jgi:hypothetical protein
MRRVSSRSASAAAGRTRPSVTARPSLSILFSEIWELSAALGNGWRCRRPWTDLSQQRGELREHHRVRRRALLLFFANLTDWAALAAVFVSTIVRRLSQASGSPNPSAIRINTSAFFPNGTVPPFFPRYVDLPIPEALLASQFGVLIQESVATLFQGSFAVDVDILCVQHIA